MKRIAFCAALSLLILACCVQQARATASPDERRQVAGMLLQGPCDEYGVPKILALAIARQESGWHPWIINVAGKDVRPQSKAEAVRVARAALRAGKSFDVGLMQINSYWIRKHGWPLEQVLCDYLSSMTDKFAIAVFEYIFVPRSWALTEKDIEDI